MPQSKSTKKFEKNKLSNVLKRRKESAKVKQRQQLSAKRKERRTKDGGGDEGDEKIHKSEHGNNTSFGDMSMDHFFQGGFQVPEMKKKKTSIAKPKIGKRKRSSTDDDTLAASDGNNTDSASITQESDLESDSGNDAEAHKEQLAALADKDPDFYKYLKENDAELLDFAEDADLADIDALSMDEAETTPRKKSKLAEDEGEREENNEVTRSLVAKWKASMENASSLRAMKETVLAFRAAAHLNEDKTKAYKYSITDSDAYHELLVTALDYVPRVLQHHLPVKENAAGKAYVHCLIYQSPSDRNRRVSTDSKKFRTLTPLLKSHIISVYHLLENLSDDSTLRLTLNSLLALLPYILSFKKIVREATKSVTSVWADNSNSETVRISAFLALRRLVIIGDPSIKEAVLKEVYQGLVKGSRNTTIHNIQGINLMKNTASELWSIDPNIGYTTGFTFIRQLAIHLRSSITNNSKDSYKTVYNWQYIHSLDFWSRVVSAHCESLREAEAGKASPLRPLIYPIVQITLGAMRLIPTAQYFPLRFQLARALLRISSATSTYIPLAPVFLEVLTSAEMKKPPKPSTLKSLDFNTSIRATKAYLRTRVYQDGVGEQVAELMSEFFVLWTKNIAMPELALPVIVVLKRWVKTMSKKGSGNRNAKINSLIALLIQKLEANSKWIEERRAKVEFAPSDRAGVENFLKDVEWEKSPLGAYVSGQRKARAQKAKLLEAARKTENRKQKEANMAEVEEDVADFSDDGEEEMSEMSIDEEEAAAAKEE